MPDEADASREQVEEVEAPDGGQEEAAPAKDTGIKPALLTLDRVWALGLIGVLCLVVRAVLATLGIGHSWLLAFTLWTGASIMFVAIRSQKLPVEGKSVLITGCDSGFGHALALQLNKMGFRVFALCLMNGEGAAELRDAGGETLHVLFGDVTKPDQLQRARKEVEKILPEGEGLWGLINNAGVAAFGDMEWLPLSTFKKISEVNVFGLITATQTFLPLIRRAQGRVVNVASMLGRMGVPMRSPYVLSKFAVEGLSDCLRHEIKQWGVSVVVVEPGNFIAGTNIFTEESVEANAKEMWANIADDVRKDYGEDLFKERVTLMKSYIKGGNTDLTCVLQAFMASLTDKWPQARYQPMDLYYKTRVFVATHFPEWLYDNIYVGCLNK